jgi:alpha-tubulin suppressor-like RCC1 family protein
MEIHMEDRWAISAASTTLIAVVFALGCAGETTVEQAGEPDGAVDTVTQAIVQDAAINANRDTTVRELLPFSAAGTATTVSVQGLSRERAIVQFDQPALVAAAAGRPVVEAALEVTIQDKTLLLGQVAAHRMKSASTEPGATWACANDTNTSNLLNNCTTANSWQMASLLSSGLPYVSSASDTENISLSTSVVRFTVTADVQAFLAGTQPNNGWLLKVQSELLPGGVRFKSRESATPPRLILDLGAPTCTPTSSTDVTCNGVDDDCSGTADEDFVAGSTSCGVGACAATGATSCVAGHVVNSCTPGAPAANDASCNGVDNDCSGQVDEDYVASATSCGVGVCAATGATSCVSGAVVDSCTPGAAAANDASCDGLDNDCSGQVDEDYVATATSCGVGVCAATGATSCVSGAVVDSCTVGSPNGSNDSICNGLDDDCDGAVDEETGTQQVACGLNGRGSQPQVCTDGAWTDSGACVDADECVDGTSDMQLCGDGAPGVEDRACVEGSWVAEACETLSRVSAGGTSNVGGHTCAIRDGGAVVCWGLGTSGQLGNGAFLTEANPVAVSGLTDAVDVSAGTIHTCAVRADASVVCWGAGASGALGNGSTANSNVPVVVNALVDAAEVGAGAAYSCARRTNGAVRCWGTNRFGQLGNGNNIDSSVPMTVSGLTTAADLDVGVSHACVATTAGSVLCWGNSRFGENGYGALNSSSNVPGAVGTLTDVIQVAAGADFSCAMRGAGTMACWGSNASGQYGNGTSGGVGAITPVAVSGLTNASRISAGGNYACVVRDDGTVACWGNNQTGQLGDGSIVNRNLPVVVAGLGDVVEVSGGDAHTCALRENGSVACWGFNADGQLGTGSPGNSNVPVTVAALSDALEVASGQNFACALRQSGNVVCWGDNSTGSLGNGSNQKQQTPVLVSGLSDAVKLATGWLHACAVRATGSVVCWGYNAFGGLGNGSFLQSNVPVPVSGLSSVIDLDAGLYHVCAVRQDGSVACWGYNASGQLGRGDFVGQSNVPVNVPGITTAVGIDAGTSHTCVERADATLTCWGENLAGQLGNGTTTNASSPVAVPGLTNVAEVAAGGNSTCALLTDGSVRCWGLGAQGQLGNAANLDSSSPVTVSALGDAVAVGLGETHACAVHVDGSVSCWGAGGAGQLGNGGNTSSNVPVAVSGLADAAAVTGGNSHTCALRDSGGVACWGLGRFGQLGDGEAWSTTPVDVVSWP